MVGGDGGVIVGFFVPGDIGLIVTWGSGGGEVSCCSHRKKLVTGEGVGCAACACHSVGLFTVGSGDISGGGAEVGEVVVETAWLVVGIVGGVAVRLSMVVEG